MKVAFITSFRFSEDYGRYARLHDLFRTLEEGDGHGFDSSIFPLIDGNNSQLLNKFGINLDQIWGSRWHNFESMVSFRRIYKHIVDYKPDILHIGTLNQVETLLGILIRKRLDIPLVIGPNIGGWYPIRPREFWENNTFLKFSNRIDYFSKFASVRLCRPNRVLVFSRYHKQMVNSILNNEGLIEILHPSVHAQFHPKRSVTKDIDLLYVGSLSKQKGYFKFVDVLEKLDGDVHLSVSVVGGWPDETPNYDTIDLQYIGHISREKLPLFYNRSRVFVCLASDEMGPTTLIEALACGIPAIVNDEDGIRDFLRNGNGLKCNRDDVDEVADCILEAMEMYDSLSASALEVADEYNMNHTITQLNNMYRGIQKMD